MTAESNPLPNSDGVRLMRVPELMRLLGVSRAVIYKRLQDDPTFPKPIHVAPRVPRWRSDEVRAWIDELSGRRAA